MDMQNVSNLQIPEGMVKTIHDKNNQLLWGAVGYDTKYVGDTLQNGVPTPDASIPIQVVTGTQVVSITDGTNTQNLTVDLSSTELAKIGSYQDYIYKSGNDWYVHKNIGKIVLDGVSGYFSTDTTLANTTRVINSSILSSAPSVSSAVALPVSNYFIGKSIWASDTEGIYTAGNDVVFRGNKSTIGTTTDAVKAWLASTMPNVYYVLATPTDTKITDNTLISQLNAVHQWLVRYGYNATVTGNLPIVIDRTNL